MAIESEALVVGLDKQFALVEVQDRQIGCGRCNEPGGCGNTMMAQMRPLKERKYRVPNLIGAVVGDHVVLSTPDGALWRASFIAYLLPLAGVIAGASIATFLTGNDSQSVMGSLGGLALGIFVLKSIEKKKLASGQAFVTMRFKQAQSCSFEQSAGQ